MESLQDIRYHVLGKEVYILYNSYSPKLKYVKVPETSVNFGIEVEKDSEGMEEISYFISWGEGASYQYAENLFFNEVEAQSKFKEDMIDFLQNQMKKESSLTTFDLVDVQKSMEDASAMEVWAGSTALQEVFQLYFHRVKDDVDTHEGKIAAQIKRKQQNQSNRFDEIEKVFAFELPF